MSRGILAHGMPVIYIGPRCARRGCGYPVWKDGICGRCWQLARFACKDPKLFAFEPADPWRDDQDAPALPWERVDELFGGPGGPPA